MAKFFIQFYKPMSDDLSSYYFDDTMVQSLNISNDFIQGNGKTISLVVKNPRNIFNSDYAGSSTNIFNQPIPFSDWRDYFVPDGQFFVAKGSYEEWQSLNDVERTKRLMGIFRINKINQALGSQILSLNGQDLMKYPMRAVAYNSTNKIWQYPPNDWAYDLMSVGQIIHDVLHKLGVWHYHKDGHIDNDSNGSLTPDGEIFYSTNMYFSPAQEKADEQILDMKYVYDFIKTFKNYTGYLFYVKDIVIDSVPRPVFFFVPPNYNDDTQTLFGSSEILLHNEPTSTHVDPIDVIEVKYGLDDSNIRGYVVVSTADSSAIIENSGQSGARMRDKKWSIGIIKSPDIKDLEINGQKVSAAKAIGLSVMTQIMDLYRSMAVNFSNWIKFDQKVYNFALNNEEVNLHINDLYVCKNVSWGYSNGLMTTSATFSWYKPDEFPKVAPTIFCQGGDQKIGVYFPQVGADEYKIYLNNVVNQTITPTNGEPIYVVINNLINGTSYNVYVGAIYDGQEVLSNSCDVIPNPNDGVGGGGGVHRYD